MYAIGCEATVTGDLGALWSTWTDMPAYPTWDPREEELRLDGPFQTGMTGFSKQVGPRPGSTFVISRVEPMTRWTTENPLPGDKLVVDHRLEPAEGGTVRLVKRYEAHGPMALVFRLIFAPGIRAQMPATFAALAAEVERSARV